MALFSERLQVARHDLFVGRAAERVLFQDAIRSEVPPFGVLYIHGLGGVGKTMLLREMRASCSVNSVQAVSVDARDIDPAPEAFLSALVNAFELDGALGSSSESSAAESTKQLARHLADAVERYVIFLDTYELLAPLDKWLREEFLPQMPDNGFLVLAGRQAPSRDWQIDSGWQSLLRTVALRNLSPEESQGYLQQRQVPESHHEAILRFTHGHPLALSLVADLFAQGKFDSANSTLFTPEGAPDIVKVLVEHLVQEISSDRHRAAIEVCALVRLTTESLLDEILPQTDVVQASAHELFTWLRSLSFVEEGRAGIFPHDLAREAIVADLSWRNPQWSVELHHRARHYYATRLQQTSGLQQQTLLTDYIFLHRSNPVVSPFLEWRETGNLTISSAAQDDVPWLLSLVEKHEGAESAQIAAHWLTTQLQAVQVLRHGNGHRAGFLLTLALNQVSPHDAAIDPAVEAALSYLRTHSPLRAGEVALLFRFWMAEDSYQVVSPTQSLIFVQIVQQYLTTPGLAFTFLPCAEPDFWAPIFSYAHAERIPEADFEVASRRYGIYSHDWRVVPPPAWLGQLADQEVSGSSGQVAPPTPTEQLVVLSEDEFAAAVQSALRHFLRPNELKHNPLLRSRLVMERGSLTHEKKVEVLQEVVKTACEKLQRTPRTTKFYWPLYHTYLHPAPSQEQAAEILDISFSSFRRHLKEGVAHVTQTLWQSEIQS